MLSQHRRQTRRVLRWQIRHLRFTNFWKTRLKDVVLKHVKGCSCLRVQRRGSTRRQLQPPSTHVLPSTPDRLVCPPSIHTRSSCPPPHPTSMHPHQIVLFPSGLQRRRRPAGCLPRPGGFSPRSPPLRRGTTRGKAGPLDAHRPV